MFTLPVPSTLLIFLVKFTESGNQLPIGTYRPKNFLEICAKILKYSEKRRYDFRRRDEIETTHSPNNFRSQTSQFCAVIS